jgi:hypothetical protein
MGVILSESSDQGLTGSITNMLLFDSHKEADLRILASYEV